MRRCKIYFTHSCVSWWLPKQIQFCLKLPSLCGFEFDISSSSILIQIHFKNVSITQETRIFVQRNHWSITKAVKKAPNHSNFKPHVTQLTNISPFLKRYITSRFKTRQCCWAEHTRSNFYQWLITVLLYFVERNFSSTLTLFHKYVWACLCVAVTIVKSINNLHISRRSLIYGQNNMQTWGLIVLLVSKMAGHAKGILESEQDKSAGVLMSQRTLAEVVEMVRTANMIHSSGVLNLQHLQKSGNDLSFDSDLIFGNKIALLGGDILLGNASTQMAQLK